MLRPTLTLLGCAALCLTLSGCRYNLLPPIPKQAAAFSLPLRLSDVTLTRQGEKLLLKTHLDGKFEPGYLQVRWFDNSKPLGEDSLWVDKQLPQASFELLAPGKGAYRAVLLFGGQVLRQAELYEVSP